MKLNLLVLRTPRLEDMRMFYSALGAHFQSERHGNGPEHYAATLGDDFVLELYPCVGGAAPDPGLRLGVRVDNIGEALHSIGQSVAPRQTEWGLRALVRDPDGRTVELLQNPSQTDCVHEPENNPLTTAEFLADDYAQIFAPPRTRADHLSEIFLIRASDLIDFASAKIASFAASLHVLTTSAKLKPIELE